MAYDKVVDSIQLEAAIKSTADAIREKTGDTTLIEWLANKGFSDAISGLSGAKIETGTLTLSETVYSPETNPLTIEHSLGIAPTFFIVLNPDMYVSTRKYSYIYSMVYYDGICFATARFSSSGYYSNGVEFPNYATPIVDADEFGLSITFAASSTKAQFGPNLVWIAGVL